MIYQDTNGVFYICTPHSGFLLRFTYESIPTHISIFSTDSTSRCGDYTYFYVNNALYYRHRTDEPAKSSSVVWTNAIRSILNGTAQVELVPPDFLETWI